MPGAKDVNTDANCLAQVTQIVNPRCKLVHKRAAGGGIDLGEKVLMLSFFMAGPDLVRVLGRMEGGLHHGLQLDRRAGIADPL